MRINLNVPPSDGNFFRESNGVVIRGNTEAAVVRALQKYRRLNKLPPGDPRREYREQMCQRNPDRCGKSKLPPPEPAPKIPKNQPASPGFLRARVIHWLTQLRRHRYATGSALVLVSNEEAAQRAQACRGCPFRKDIPAGCGSCSEVMKAMRSELAAGRSCDDSLGGCEILGIDCACAVFLDEVRIDNPALPAHCFRKLQT